MKTSKRGSEGRAGLSGITVVAGVLVVGGVILAATVNMVFLAVFGAGAFGPGVLREMGILHDQDEFQRDASRAAGYRAYLAAGLFVSVWLAVAQRGVRNLDSDVALTVSMVLILLVVVWLVAVLFGYWGVRRAASRILLAFGCFWLGFSAIPHLTEPGTLLIESLIAAPFFAFAWTAQRWPRATGALLALFGVFTFFAYDMYEAFGSRMNAWPAILLMFVPVMACGIGLLGAKPDGATDEAGDPLTGPAPGGHGKERMQEP